MGPIPDHIQPELRILFIGYNPSLRSGELGHHYANPNNRFWSILHQAGVTDRKYSPLEDKSLLSVGFGFTNIVARPTKTAEEITKQEYAEGRELLQAKLKRYRPRIACFVGKGVYEQYSGRRSISWGVQEPGTVTGVIDFVAPSSSGLVRMKISEIVDIYQKLIPLLQTLEKDSERILNLDTNLT